MTQYLKLYGEKLIERGYSIVPLPPGTKGPRLEGWQNLRATAEDVRKWTSNGRAHDGVGVLARNTPPVDMDIEDQAVVDEMVAVIRELFPTLPPSRIGRAPRVMFVCRTDEPFSKVQSAKYVDPLLGGKFQVEILGDGQQFVAFHIHPDTGQPYVWPGESLFDLEWSSLPVMTLGIAQRIVDAFELIAERKVQSGEWDRISKGRPGRLSGAAPEASVPMGVSDAYIRDVLGFIDPDKGGYATWLQTGQELHHETGGSARGLELWDAWSAGAESSATGYAGREVIEGKWGSFGANHGPQATFRSTQHRARSNGWVPPIEDNFEVLPVLADGQGGEIPELPALKRNRHGEIEAVIENVVAAVRRSDLVGARVAYDAFRDAIVVAPHATEDWQPLRDADYTRYRIRLAEQIGFKPVGADMMRDAVMLVAEECVIDSAQWWLSRQAWDGVPRVETFLAEYFGTGDTPYARAVSRYLWTALAGRVLAPGCQVDMVPILEGEQGLRKTSAVAAIAPGVDHFVEIGFDEDETDLARKMRGALVAELGELHGLHAKAIEGVKKFITRRHENWTPKYKEFNTKFPRRLVFIGTTNQTELLADETGNRRWLPIHVNRADVEGIERDRSQLWAEGAALFQAHGVQFREAEELAAPMHELYLSVDAWEASVVAWLALETDFAEGGVEAEKWGQTPFTSMDVAVGALRLTPGQVHAGITRRIGAVLRKLGYKQKTTRIKGEKNPVFRWRAENY